MCRLRVICVLYVGYLMSSDGNLRSHFWGSFKCHLKVIRNSFEGHLAVIWMIFLNACQRYRMHASD